ncbi:MAG: hypothetical protein OEW25_01435 [Nitrospira sp.]|nr:hypothetical protein [Nitrospira sp.]
MMIYRALLPFVLLLLAAPTWAMENYSQVLRDQYGRAIGGATVTVYVTGTTTLATLFSNNTGTAKANPFLTDALDGRFNFYAVNGVYDIIYTYPGATFDANHSRRIPLFDENDFSGGGGGGIDLGAAFPTSPTVDELFYLTSDSTVGDCIAGGGTARTLCAFLAEVWVPVNAIPEADTPQTVFGRGNSVSGIDESRKVEWRGEGTMATSGFNLYVHSSGKFVFKCVNQDVEGDCGTRIDLTGTHKYQIYTDSGLKFEVDGATGAITEATLDVETAGVTLTTTDEQWWDVVSCQGSTAAHIWNTITATVPAAACDTGTNTQKGYASFDATTDEAIHMDWVLPTGFTGEIDVHFIWKAAATSGATGWCAQLIRVADAATSDPAFPAQASSNCVSDTAKGTTLQENHTTITGVTCTSCAARDHVYVRISRDANGGAVTDDMTGDAHLMKVGRTWRVAK